jgi:curved DNA-binding protein
MEFKDYYKILEVERTADQKAISQAFRRLARRYHPDVNPGNAQAEQRFKEINEAYQVLSDPQRRAKYDQVLELRQRGGSWEEVLRRGAGNGGTYTVYGSPEDLEQFSDFFRQLFGGLGGGIFGGTFGQRDRGARGGARAFDLEELLRRQTGQGQARQAPGQDVQGDVDISLEEAYHGTQRTVTVQLDGRQRAIDVTIPRGVRSGQRLRVAGQGPGGGDLYLTVRIQPHPVFTRQDDDVLCDIEVPIWVAALGGTVDVPTLGGPVAMTIPPGTHAGQTFRLRGRGMPRQHETKVAGDQLVRVRLALPQPLTARDRELLEEMRRQHETRTASN